MGDGQRGGDSSAVQDELRNVQQIQATKCAFAGIFRHGSVVTCIAADFGGVNRAVQELLKNVQQIQASYSADGSVVTWGDARHGGDSSVVQDQLKNVQQIQATRYVVLLPFSGMALS